MRRIFGLKNYFRFQDNSGVTLLLAVLVLSSVLAISFSIATILLVEVRTSGDLLRTEKALYGAQSVSEQALFGVDHSVSASIMASAYTTSTSDGKVAMTNTTTPLTDTQFRDVVKTTSVSLEGTVNRYPLYNISATDPYTAGSGYGSVKVTYLDNGNQDPLEVYICQFDPNAVYNLTECTDPSSPNMSRKGPFTISGTYGPWFMDPNKQQELILYNGKNPGPPSGDIYVQIEAFTDTLGTVPRGIPYFNKTVVDIGATNGDITRKIRTYIPNNPY